MIEHCDPGAVGVAEYWGYHGDPQASSGTEKLNGIGPGSHSSGSRSLLPK